VKRYTIELTSYAKKIISSIKDRRIKKNIMKQIDSLEEDPEKKGKPLVKALSGFYSIRASGQRYRIIYKIEKSRVLVYVVTIGLRKEGSPKDIYSLTKKLVRLKLLDIPEIFEINDENINLTFKK